MHYSSSPRLPVWCWPIVYAIMVTYSLADSKVPSPHSLKPWTLMQVHWARSARTESSVLVDQILLFSKFSLHLPGIDQAELRVWQGTESHKRLDNSKRKEIELSILHILRISDFACLSLAWKIQSPLLLPLNTYSLCCNYDLCCSIIEFTFLVKNLINVLIWHALLLYMIELQCNWQRTLWKVKKFKYTALT